MDEIDIRIDEILNGELMIPESFMRMVERTLNNLPERPLKHKKKIARIKACLVAVCCTMFMTTGIAFANEIIAFIKNVFNNSNGIDKAVQNGYIQELEENIVESNDTEISVENFLMDDFNLSFTFNVKLEEEMSNKISNIEFLDIIITDENKNILYSDSKETIKRYCNSDNFEHEEMTTGLSKRINGIEENTINLVYNFFSDKFPKSQQLYIDISKIKCEKINGEQIILNGKWNMEVEIPEKFFNRSSQIYYVTNCNIEEMKYMKLEVLNTGTKIEFMAKLNEIFNEDDSNEVKKLKRNTILEWMSKEALVINDSIENQDGKKYYPIESSSEDEECKYRINGEFIYKQTFDMIINESTDKLKVKFDINLPNEIKKVEIELERKNKM